MNELKNFLQKNLLEYKSIFSGEAITVMNALFLLLTWVLIFNSINYDDDLIGLLFLVLLVILIYAYPLIVFLFAKKYKYALVWLLLTGSVIIVPIWFMLFLIIFLRLVFSFSFYIWSKFTKSMHPPKFLDLEKLLYSVLIIYIPIVIVLLSISYLITGDLM